MARVRTSPGQVAATGAGEKTAGPGAMGPDAFAEKLALSGAYGKVERARPPWGAIVESVFRLDAREVYARLVAELSLGDGATEYGVVLAAVDCSARNIFDSARLVRAAKLEDERLGSSIDERLEVLRSTARAELEQEKTEGKRSKAPTIQDIDDRMVAGWPDEARALRASKAEMHGALRAAEGLETAWRSRASDLRAMLDRFQHHGS